MIDFTRHPDSEEEINVLATNYIDMKKLLTDNNLHMPNDAKFLAVTFIKATYNPHFDTENILVTTHGYHNF